MNFALRVCVRVIPFIYYTIILANLSTLFGEFDIFVKLCQKYSASIGKNPDNDPIKMSVLCIFLRLLAKTNTEYRAQKKREELIRKEKK